MNEDEEIKELEKEIEQTKRDQKERRNRVRQLKIEAENKRLQKVGSFIDKLLRKKTEPNEIAILVDLEKALKLNQK